MAVRLDSGGKEPCGVDEPDAPGDRVSEDENKVI